MRAGLVHAGVMVLVSGAARADAPISLHDGLLAHDDEPVLHIDPLVLPNLVAQGVQLDGDQLSTITLGKHSWAELHGVEWSDKRDIPGHGWTASLRLARDIGPFTIAATGSVNSVESWFGGFRYYEVGLSIGKSKRLSRWVTAWIALSVGRRVWIGEPPDGEPPESSAVMLSLGWTFK